MIGGIPLLECKIDLLGGMGDGFWPVHFDQAVGGPIDLQLQQPFKATYIFPGYVHNGGPYLSDRFWGR